MTKYTDCCPNCDAYLSERVWDGEQWECAECDESGIFHARQSTTGFETLRELSQTDRLRNVANDVIEVATPNRSATGHGRLPGYSANKHTIAWRALHLAELVLQYIDGETVTIDKSISDEIPF